MKDRIQDRVAPGPPPCGRILDGVVDDVVGHMGKFLGDAPDLITVVQRRHMQYDRGW